MKNLLLFVALSLGAQAPDAEKRYMAAFEAAHKAIDASRTATNDAKPEEAKQLLDSAATEVESVLRILESMGKPPYKNSSNYKKAELRTREVLRRIDTLLRDAGFEEREILKSAHERVTAVHEKLLEGVMSKKP
jgi:hypothetical protein